MVNYGTNNFQNIGGRAVCNVANWCKRINEFEEELAQLKKDKARMLASLQRADDLGFFGAEFLRPIANAVWRCNKSIDWYERELRIDKAYISP